MNETVGDDQLKGVKSHLCPLNHLVAGAESFLHHGSNLLGFKFQLLPDQVHLQGKLQREKQRGQSPQRRRSDVSSSPDTEKQTGQRHWDRYKYHISKLKLLKLSEWNKNWTLPIPVCPHRVDPRKLGQFLWQRLQLAEVPAAFSLLSIDLPQQEVPTHSYISTLQVSACSPATGLLLNTWKIKTHSFTTANRSTDPQTPLCSHTSNFNTQCFRYEIWFCEQADW